MRLRGGALAAASFITFLAAGLVQAADPAIAPAPAFTAPQLLAPPPGHAGQMRLVTKTGRNHTILMPKGAGAAK